MGRFSFTLSDVRNWTQAEQIRGDLAEETVLHGIASLESAAEGDLAFLGNTKYRSQLATCRASVILVPGKCPGEPQPGQTWLEVKHPSLALARVCARLEDRLRPVPKPGIHATAVIAESATIDATAHIGPLCVVEAGATIGPGVVLQAQNFVGRHASIGRRSLLAPGARVADYCLLGERVILHMGVVIGSDGFGFETEAGRHEKVPQIGIVVVEDDVEIGANSAIDRARFGETRIGEGTKIDNLVQIGHNVVTGKHCLLCGQVGISGSSTLGDYVVLGGQAGIGGHLKVGSGAMIGGQTGISKDTEPKAYMRGTPARPYMVHQRLQVLTGKLPELFERVGDLEKLIRQSGPDSPA